MYNVDLLKYTFIFITGTPKTLIVQRAVISLHIPRTETPWAWNLFIPD